MLFFLYTCNGIFGFVIMYFATPVAGREKDVARRKRSIYIGDDRFEEGSRRVEGQARGNRMGTVSEIGRTRARQITTERYSSAFKMNY